MAIDTTDVTGTLATLVSIIDDSDFDVSAPDQVRDLVQYINVQVRAVAEPEPADMSQIATEWLESRNIIAQALREMGIASDTVEHNAAAIIARLSHSDFVVQKS